MPFLVLENGHSVFKQRVSLSDLCHFTEQLSLLMTSGIDLERSLVVIQETLPDSLLTDIAHDMRVHIVSGETFSQALGHFPETFDNLYTSIVFAGEVSGKVGENLQRLASALYEKLNFQNSLKAALIYPAILLTVVLGTLSLFIWVIVPEFEAIFHTNMQGLPKLTQIVIGICSFIRSQFLYVAISLTLLAGSILFFINSPRYKIYLHRALMQSRLTQNWVVTSNLHIYTSIFGNLLLAGVPITMAMELATNSLQNSAIRHDLRECLQKVEFGESFPQVISSLTYLPPMVVQLSFVGYETAQLGMMLTKCSEILSQDLSLQVKTFLSLFSPLITLILGLIIALLVISLATGLMSINSIAI